MEADTPKHQGSGADEDTQQPKQITSTADDESSAGTKRNREEQLAMDTLAQARGGGEDVVHCSSEKMAANTPERQGSHVDQDRQRSNQITSMDEDDSIMGMKRTKEEQLAMGTLAQAPGGGEHVGHYSTDKMAPT
jgi:hypothetical protein